MLCFACANGNLTEVIEKYIELLGLAQVVSTPVKLFIRGFQIRDNKMENEIDARGPQTGSHTMAALTDSDPECRTRCKYLMRSLPHK